MTVTNNGPGDAGNVVVIEDNAVGAVTFISSSPSAGSIDDATGIWTVGSLAVGESATNTITARATEAGTAINSVFVESDNPDNNGDNNTASASVVVEADGGGLPSTGSDTSQLLGIGGLGLLLGGLLVLVSRRRSTV